MSLYWILTVQWLHILAGIVWVGGMIFSGLVVWPWLASRPAAEGLAFLDGVGRSAGAVMGTAGFLVIVLGLLRGTWLGPIRSWDALLGTAYGWTFLAAIGLTLFAGGYLDGVRRSLPARLWDGDRPRAGAAAYLRRTNAIMLTAFSAIVLCMVLMRFGL